MSIEWMTHIWNNSKHKSSRLLMMLAIADYANDSGTAYPSIETLAQRTRQTMRNAIRIIEKLEDSGELKSEKYGSPYGTNLYALKVKTTEKRRQKPSKRSSDILGAKPEMSRDNSGSQLSPDPSLPIIDDPSEIKDSANRPRQPRARDLHFENLSDICGMTPPERDWKRLVKTAAGQLNRYAKELREVGATPEQITAFGEWWAANDWRSLKGQLPKPADVVKSWPLYVNGHTNRNILTNGNDRKPLEDWQTRPGGAHDEYLRLNWKFLTPEQLAEAIEKGIHTR